MLANIKVKEYQNYYKTVALHIKFTDEDIFNQIKNKFNIKNYSTYKDEILHIHYEVKYEDIEKLYHMLSAIKSHCINDQQSLILLENIKKRLNEITSLTSLDELNERKEVNITHSDLIVKFKSPLMYQTSFQPFHSQIQIEVGWEGRHYFNVTEDRDIFNIASTYVNKSIERLP